MKGVFAACAAAVALLGLGADDADPGADNAESAAFTYDTRYAASGLTPDFSSAETWGLSPRFSLWLVDLAKDSNNDRIPDWWEEQYGLSGEAASADHDGDGFTNLEEYNMGTDPTKKNDYSLSSAESARYELDMSYRASGLTFASTAEIWGLSPDFSLYLVDLAEDSNSDGIPDWWEESYGLSGALALASADPDGDGRTNLEEYNMGTDPTKKEDWLAAIKESDGAFIADTRIVYTGEKPVFGEAFCVFAVSGGFVCDTDGLYYDWDGDGVATWWNASTTRDGSGESTDSDNDGIPDWWVTSYGLDGVEDVAEKDSDGDGMTNYEEFIAGTDPSDALSFFAITSVQIEVVPDPETDGFALQWPSVKGRIYTVYAADAPVGPWEAISEMDGTGATLTNCSDGTRTARFFKVAVRLK